jgi:hypothetical protein
VAEDTSDDLPQFPVIEDLHLRGHQGLTPKLSAAYAEAAAVCLSRHHTPPRALTVRHDQRTLAYKMTWSPPSNRERDAWANDEDATRDGAYGVVLAAADCHLGLVTRRRAKAKTGADYFVGPPLSPELVADEDLYMEDVFRLEVSGSDHPTSEAELHGRLTQKMDQARRGHPRSPAIAGVVGFSLCLVLFNRAV